MIERRKHKRYPVKQNTFVVLRSKPSKLGAIRQMRMSEVALAVFRSKPVRMGRIDNISRGGLSFSYPETKLHPRKSLGLEILLADCNFYLDRVPYKIVSDVKLKNDVPRAPISMWRCRVQFGKLEAGQAAQLQRFLKKHTSPPP